MRSIRVGVFETNSSSCHSISFSKDYLDKQAEKDIQNYISDNSLVIELGEFGWGYDESRSSYVKASYILTMCHVNEDIINMRNILELIGTVTHCLNVSVSNENNCYIDHESVMSIKSLLEDIPGKTLMDKAKNFIFDSRIKLIIDGAG
jgi:hypothetical protein